MLRDLLDYFRTQQERPQEPPQETRPPFRTPRVGEPATVHQRSGATALETILDAEWDERPCSRCAGLHSVGTCLDCGGCDKCCPCPQENGQGLLEVGI
jgi:hypothetical protein